MLKLREKFLGLETFHLFMEILPSWISGIMIISISTIPFMKTWPEPIRLTIASITQANCTIITTGIYISNWKKSRQVQNWLRFIALETKYPKAIM